MATTPTFSTGLLGYYPRQKQLDQQKLWATLYGQAQSPYAQIGMGVGQLLGAGVGMLTGDTAEQKREKTLLNLQQDANTKFTPGTPEYYNYIAESIPPEYAEAKAYAAQAAQKASIANQESYMKQATYLESNPSQLGMVSAPQAAALQNMLAQATQANGGQPLSEAQIAALQASPQFQQAAGLVSAADAGMQKREGTIGEQVNKEIFNKFLNLAGGDRTKAAELYAQDQQNKKVKVAQAGVVPSPGNVPLDVLKQGRSIVKDYTDAPAQSLKDIQVIAATGKALKTNPTLLPQFQTQIAQFTKDKQIGYKQIQNALGSDGIASDIVEGFNKFIEGKPSNIKIDDVLRGVKALEKVYGEQYNKGIEEAKTLLTQGKIPEETQKALLPSPYKIPVAPPKVGEIRGGYRFKGGDPSKKENYEAVK